MQKMSLNIFFRNDRNNLLLASMFAALVVLPILIYGVPYGYDMPHHYQCALTYLDALRSGDFYPSWTLDRNLGYGALELRMYPPLSHYILAIFALVFNDWHLASWANYTFWWILGSIGIYLFAREFVKPQAALFASALFSVMPYRLSQLYLTFLYSELCAIAILPFCFLFLTRILKESDEFQDSERLNLKNIFSANILGLTISYAVLTLTHLPMTVIGSLSLGVYFLAQVKWNYKSFFTAFLKSTIGIIFALLSTSFFWMKVLQERFLMAKNDVYPEIFVEYQNNFLITFIQKYDSINSEVWGTTIVYDVILILILVIALPVGLIGFCSAAKSVKRRYRGIWLTSSVSVFLTTVLSSFLWNNLPLLYEVQFPWRFLGIVSIFAPLFASLGVLSLKEWLAAPAKKFYAVILVGTIWVSCVLAVSQCVNGAVYKAPSFVNEYVKQVGEIEGFTFWWTKFARKEFVERKINKVLIENRGFSINEWTSTEREISIDSGSSGETYIATFYHPSWQASVNGSSTDVRQAKDGGILLSVPTESSTVRLSFVENSAIKIGRWLSFFCWILLLCCGLFHLKTLLIKNRNKIYE